MGLFCLLYFGTLAVIGAASPGGTFHSDFIARYFDYVSWIKLSLMRFPAYILRLFGISTHEEPGFLLRMDGGAGVIIAYSCVGYGVYSFWVAFVVANKDRWQKKLSWAVIGVIALWFINSIRILLVLVAINKDWPMPFGIDHHTWFNIAAYLLIFTMIFMYDKNWLKGVPHHQRKEIKIKHS